MAQPWRVALDASNQPSAAQNYTAGSALTGFRAATVLVDGDPYLLLAEEVDANGASSGAWELSEAIWDNTAGEFQSRTLVQSSSGALIDWGAVGATPRLRVLSEAGSVTEGWVKVADLDAAAAYAIDFDSFEAGYRYHLLFHKLGNSYANAAYPPYLDAWVDDPPTTAAVVSTHFLGIEGASIRNSTGSSNNTGRPVTHTNAPQNSDDRLNIEFTLDDPGGTGYCHFGWRAWGSGSNPAYDQQIDGGGHVRASGPVTRFRVRHQHGSGTFNAGKVYRRRERLP